MPDGYPSCKELSSPPQLYYVTQTKNIRKINKEKKLVLNDNDCSAVIAPLLLGTDLSGMNKLTKNETSHTRWHLSSPH